MDSPAERLPALVRASERESGRCRRKQGGNDVSCLYFEPPVAGVLYTIVCWIRASMVLRAILHSQAYVPHASLHFTACISYAS